MNKIIVQFLAISGSIVLSHAVPLENWRMPFYRIAVEQNEVSSSPSTMFWDDMPAADLFHSVLWSDSTKTGKRCWTVEPAFTEYISSDPFLSGKKFNAHVDAVSDFRYNRLLVRTALDVDQSSRHDPYYPWKKDRISAGRIDEAYVQYTGNHGFARLGRLNRNWGPFYDRSILLSNNPYSYDAFEWQFYCSFLEFRHLFTAFPYALSYWDTKNSLLNRYFSAHALNFIFGEWGSLGISETVIFSRVNGLPDLQFVNPFSIYTVINTNGEGNANLMVGFQGWVHPFSKKITLKGQIIFDDIQVDDKTAFDQEPTHWAGDFGLYWTDPFILQLPHNLAFEYRYLSRWVYTVTDANTYNGERYTYLGRSLGFEDIDGDFLKGAFTVAGNNYWAVTGGLSLTRKDTNTVSSLWHSDTGLGYRKEKRLSQRPTLKTTFSFLIQAHGYFKNYCDAHLSVENRWIQDKRAASHYTYDPLFMLSVSIHYSNFLVKFRSQ